MAFVALTSLIATMELEFLQPIPRISLHDEASISIKSFFKKLSSLQEFLEEKSGGGAALRDLEINIRNFALDAEDRIEIQISNFLLANNTEDQEKASQELHQTLREAAENAAELLNISSEVDDDEANECQPVIPIAWLSDRSLLHQPPKLEGRMVGRRHDYLLVKNQLLYGDERRVILIVGMNGIGKTTLAASVYEDLSIASHFDVRGWITMSGEYNVRQMLHDLPLTGKRYLIVLDNLWNNRNWEHIQGCFPNDRNGSRIVLTTTHFDQGSYTSFDCFHNMTLLDSKESWDLFCNNPFLKQHMAPKFEKIRSQVLEKCEGLPQAIVTVAQRLSKCNNIQQEWKKVEKELELLGVLDNKALTLRYNQMPQHLKVCFLYFGVFPKRSVIQVKHLVRLWTVEGFLNPLRNDEGLEILAYEYLQELIDRSLVLIDKQSFDGKIKMCKMHSALHSFCVREGQKEGIFCAMNTQQYPQGSFNMFANSCRWLSLYTHSFDYYVLFGTNNPRSIFFFQENAEVFVPFKLLRVLAFAPSSFLQRVPCHLENLVFLRYLSVIQWFEGLEDILSINRNLQTLVVSGDESQLGVPTLHLPCRIWESPQLKHLEIGNLYTIEPPSMVKENLQTLSWVNPTHCKVEVYYRFPNIRKLKIFYEDDLEHCHNGGSCSNNPIILDKLNYLVWLEMLTISVSASCTITLPKQHMFPLQLKKLRLSGTNLCHRDLTVIGMLPQLEVLKLENGFYGKVWKVANGGFRWLRFLLLEAEKLEQLIVYKHSFSCIERLVLRFCYCLKSIPIDVVYYRTLRSIELEQCGRSVIASANYIQQIIYEFGNENFKLKIEGSEYDES